MTDVQQEMCERRWVGRSGTVGKLFCFVLNQNPQGLMKVRRVCERMPDAGPVGNVIEGLGKFIVTVVVVRIVVKGLKFWIAVEPHVNPER